MLGSLNVKYFVTVPKISISASSVLNFDHFSILNQELTEPRIYRAGRPCKLSLGPVYWT